MNQPIHVDNVSEQFSIWMRLTIRPAFPHQCAVIGFGSRHALGIRLNRFFGIDMPPDYMKLLEANRHAPLCPALKEWFSEQTSVLFRSGKNNMTTSERIWEEKLVEAGLTNVLVNGHDDHETNQFTLIKLYNVSLVNETDSELEARFTQALIPQQVHLEWRNKLGNRSFNEGVKSKSSLELSSKELEVLQWIRLGKSNKEIARILSKSEYTIKTQVHSILSKSGVKNRTELAMSTS
jgi:DNA-binding NarL/FixJ family response regulator